MSRFVVLVCMLMLVTAVVSVELPGGLKPTDDLPKPEVPKLPDLPNKAPDAKSLQDVGDKS